MLDCGAVERPGGDRHQARPGRDAGPERRGVGGRRPGPARPGTGPPAPSRRRRWWSGTGPRPTRRTRSGAGSGRRRRRGRRRRAPRRPRTTSVDAAHAGLGLLQEPVHVGRGAAAAPNRQPSRPSLGSGDSVECSRSRIRARTRASSSSRRTTTRACTLDRLVPAPSSRPRAAGPRDLRSSSSRWVARRASSVWWATRVAASTRPPGAASSGTWGTSTTSTSPGRA